MAEPEPNSSEAGTSLQSWAIRLYRAALWLVPWPAAYAFAIGMDWLFRRNRWDDIFLLGGLCLVFSLMEICALGWADVQLRHRFQNGPRRDVPHIVLFFLAQILMFFLLLPFVTTL